MKSFKTLVPLLGIYCLLLCLYSCQSINSQDKAISTQVSEKMITVKEFKQLSPEEQWKVISPVRRNHLRDLHFNQNISMPLFMRKLIEKYPEMEESPIRKKVQTSEEKLAIQEQKRAESERLKITRDQAIYQPDSEVYRLLKMTPEEQWETFSEKRKKYMQANPTYYPDFKNILSK